MSDTLGLYNLVRPLGRAATADVYLAREDGAAMTSGWRAIKRMRTDLSGDPSFVTMLVDEVRTAMRLDHPNIARYYELGKHERDWFITMEYVPGCSLAALIDRAQACGVRIGEEVALFVAVQILEGLAYAHSRPDPARHGHGQELVHRDISPHNILLGFGGAVKIAAFGLAKAASQSARTRGRYFAGKYGYLAPEQLRGLDVDGRADVFATGVLLYELLTLNRLFEGHSDLSIADKVRNAQIYPLRAPSGDIDPALATILRRASKCVPAERYPSAAAMRNALRTLAYERYGGLGPEGFVTLLGRLFAREITDERRTLARATHPTALEPTQSVFEGVTEVDDPREPLRALRVLCAACSVAAVVLGGWWMGAIAWQ
ncbi:MAG TPA: serine/threonine-protein kinase [Myxococcota bacterium]|nr:serine/threonine-protein kinase [Myxococcota bacterium]